MVTTIMKNVDIHGSAVVHPGAQISDDVEIGPHSVIGEHVSIGRGTKIGSQVVVEDFSSIGEDNNIFTGAVIGTIPQDLKFKGEKSFLEIGNRNTIREFVTINRGTSKGGGKTVIGDDNLLMAYCHVAHDCNLGNHVVMANAATLGGHVILEDRVIVSGLTGLHHYVRVGCMSLLGGCSKVLIDIPPYCIADGRPAKVRGLNSIGLRRNNIPVERRNHLKSAYKLLYRSGLNYSVALVRIEDELPETPEVRHLVEFVKTITHGKMGRAKQPR